MDSNAILEPRPPSFDTAVNLKANIDTNAKIDQHSISIESPPTYADYVQNAEYCRHTP